MSDIIRRDPRAEWIARNRLHPLHAAMQPQQHSWMGPNGVIRKNVHGVGFIGPNGLKRIDRSGAQQHRQNPSSARRPAPHGVPSRNRRPLRGAPVAPEHQ